MILNSINLSSLNKINFQNSQKANQISFAQKPDKFEKAFVSSFNFEEEVSSEAKKQILEKIKTIENFPLGPLGIGATGVVYQLNNIDGFGADGVVVKFSHTQDKNPITGEKQKPNCNSYYNLWTNAEKSFQNNSKTTCSSINNTVRQNKHTC